MMQTGLGPLLWWGEDQDDPVDGEGYGEEVDGEEQAEGGDEMVE